MCVCGVCVCVVCCVCVCVCARARAIMSVDRGGFLLVPSDDKGGQGGEGHQCARGGTSVRGHGGGYVQRAHALAAGSGQKEQKAFTRTLAPSQHVCPLFPLVFSAGEILLNCIDKDGTKSVRTHSPTHTAPHEFLLARTIASGRPPWVPHATHRARTPQHSSRTRTKGLRPGAHQRHPR